MGSPPRELRIEALGPRRRESATAMFSVIHKNQEMPARSLRGKEAGTLLTKPSWLETRTISPHRPSQRMALKDSHDLS